MSGQTGSQASVIDVLCTPGLPGMTGARNGARAPFFRNFVENVSLSV